MKGINYNLVFDGLCFFEVTLLKLAGVIGGNR